MMTFCKRRQNRKNATMAPYGVHRCPNR